MDFTERIKNITLTKTEKVIADFVIDNLNTVGLKTITELAHETGVSDTSIIRFVRTIGYSGYASFKREMCDRIMQQYNDGPLISEKYESSTLPSLDEDLITYIRNCAVDNIRKSCDALDIKTVDEISHALIDSSVKYVCAFRSTACCADYLCRKLSYFIPNIVSCTEDSSRAIEQLVDIGPEDCLLLFSFPRYSTIAFNLLEIARQNGAKVIVITDRVTSPLAYKADLVVTVSVDGATFFNSYVAPLCVSDIIIASVSKIIGDTAKDRMSVIDHFTNKVTQM